MNTYANAPDVSGNQFLSKVYTWMFLGLLLTAVASYAVMSSASLQATMFGLMWILIIIELAVVLLLIWRIKSMSPSTAAVAFIFYSVLSGITLTPILTYYTLASVFVVFLISAGMFIGMSLVGYFIKKDLSGFGRFLMMALIGLIIAMIGNMVLFYFSPTTASVMSFFISVAAVLLFAGLTAYDTQKIKKLGQSMEHGNPYSQKLAIICALNLYLDFINLFIHMLRLFGRRQ
ncbi:MAG: Bax inhibitor-1/YccA family protein [Methanimicrococcus sp.]|nr:Bax inhibitor-1/YccA family protein [Methanimicrococcus sp.]